MLDGKVEVLKSERPQIRTPREEDHDNNQVVTLRLEEPGLLQKVAEPSAIVEKVLGQRPPQHRLGARDVCTRP